MKNYTPPLVNIGKEKTTIKTFFFGNAAAKNYYYCARHKTEDIYLLWIESSRFGKTYCFPCVLEEQGDPMIYLTGKGMDQKMKNSSLIQRWGLFVNPASFREEYEPGELTPENFHAEYGKYKRIALDRLFADAPAEAEADADPAQLTDGEAALAGEAAEAGAPGEDEAADAQADGQL